MSEGKCVDGRVRVRMRVGEVEFEVECDVSQLESAVGKVLGMVAEKLRDMPALAEKPAVVVPQRAETCKGVIQRLWEEGFFGDARSLDEVHAEMARRGFHYDRTAVAHALIDLVKEGILTRMGKPRRYQYSQKRPPPASANSGASAGGAAGGGGGAKNAAAVVVERKKPDEQ